MAFLWTPFEGLIFPWFGSAAGSLGESRREQSSTQSSISEPKGLQAELRRTPAPLTMLLTAGAL